MNQTSHHNCHHWSSTSRSSWGHNSIDVSVLVIQKPRLAKTMVFPALLRIIGRGGMEINIASRQNSCSCLEVACIESMIDLGKHEMSSICWWLDQNQPGQSATAWLFGDQTHEISKFRAAWIIESSSGRFAAKGANVPTKRLVCMVRRAVAPPSSAHKESICILQSFGVTYRISCTVKPVIDQKS